MTTAPISDAPLKLLQSGIYFGTSSWKYEGWKGLIYQKAYKTAKAFNETCLEEYARHYPCVGIDHTYYTWPTTQGFEKYLTQVPHYFKFGMKATEKITVFKYPNLPRYGQEAGKINANFLNPELFAEKFLNPLIPYRENIGPIMLEFSQFYPGMLKNGSEFVERLDHFFSKLSNPHGFEIAIEMRNANWLQPAYFDCLMRNQLAHVFNSWSRMPKLGEQFHLSKGFKPPAIVARLLLNPGAVYQEAVDAYAPYHKLHLQLSELRSSTIELIRYAKEIGVPAYVFVNNRFEGCAPKTIEALVNEYLKRDSPED